MHYSANVAFLGKVRYRSKEVGDVKSYEAKESTNNDNYSSDDDS